MFARYAGVITVGTFISGMLAVAEATRRTAWIEVRYPGAGRKMTLDGVPIHTGGNRRCVTMFDPKLAGTEILHRKTGGKPMRDDAVPRTVTVVKPGTVERIGSLTVTVFGRNGKSEVGFTGLREPP